MFFRTLIIVSLAAISAAASADFRTVARAYEIALSDFQAPATVNGKLMLRECSSCEQHSIRVDTATRYEINQQVVDLQEFKRQLLEVRNRENEWVTVLHHLERDTVTAVSITL